jgi:hypothetical protein
MHDLPTIEEWVGTIDLTTGRVDRYTPMSQAGSCLFRTLRRHSRKILFHTHPVSTKLRGSDRPSGDDIYAAIRLHYPIHVIVTRDGIYTLEKTGERSEALRRSELFHRLLEWERHTKISSAKHVPHVFHLKFNLSSGRRNYYHNHIRDRKIGYELICDDARIIRFDPMYDAIGRVALRHDPVIVLLEDGIASVEPYVDKDAIL